MMKEKKLIKVCGMREAENIRQLDDLMIDLVGFIFYPKSPRYISEKPLYLPSTHKRVGVFVNESIDEINKNIDLFSLTFIQLHGNESPEYCKELTTTGKKLIKAFSVAGTEDLIQTESYEGLCDYFLFDTKCPNHGGSGIQFDWRILENYKGNTPFLLSGGIGMDSISALKKFHHPQLAGYDLNSKFEIQPGYKDISLLKEFLTEWRGI